MAVVLQYLFFFSGICLLAWGYLRRSRNVLLGGALSLFLGGSFVDLATGVRGGYEAAVATHQALEREHVVRAPRATGR